MQRVHLFEFEDQRWFPQRLRRAMQLYLTTAYKWTPLPKLWAELLVPLMRRDRANVVVDVASGGGGPLPIVSDELRRLGFNVDITLTDLFPNPAATRLRYWPEPVDARNLPLALAGIRTMFASFHHFHPDDARRILRDAFSRRLPICIFEATTRTGAATAILIPILVLVLTPTIRPISWTQILFTYVIPILPILIFWDGLVSHLRTYSVRELGELVIDLSAPDYAWKIGEICPARMPFSLPYLIGIPVR